MIIKFLLQLWVEISAFLWKCISLFSFVVLCGYLSAYLFWYCMLSNLLTLVLCTVWREHAHMSEWQMTLLTAWLTSELLSSLLDNSSSLDWTIVHDDLWAPLGGEEHFALNHLSGAQKVLRGTLETVLVFWTLTHIHHDHSGFGSFLLPFVPFNAPP